MFNANVLTFQEFSMHAPLLLSAIHEAVLEFLRDRDDAVLFGAQAVNAYVSEPRMTQDIDLLSTRAAALAKELHAYLKKRFHIAVRIREIGKGRGYRIYQKQQSGNRHLVDIRPITAFPETRRIAHILVMAPVDLIAGKVIAYHQRRGKPKAGTDWRDIAMLLLRFPDLKRESGPVAERLHNAAPQLLPVWQEIVGQEIVAEDDDDEFWNA